MTIASEQVFILRRHPLGQPWCFVYMRTVLLQYHNSDVSKTLLFNFQNNFLRLNFSVWNKTNIEKSTALVEYLKNVLK